MTLQDLVVNEAVSLEIIWNNNEYLVHTTVVGKIENGTMIAPFVFNGSELELNSVKNPRMVFHLYGIDPKTNSRRVWKNVTVETVKSKGHLVYLVRVNSFRTIAADGERRQKKRIPLNSQATVYPEGGFARMVVKLNDISDGGISFLLPKNSHANTEGRMSIMFDDNIRGHHFNLSLDCVFVHKRERDNEYLIGCSYTRVDKDLLAYICLKRAEYEVKLQGEDEI